MNRTVQFEHIETLILVLIIDCFCCLFGFVPACENYKSGLTRGLLGDFASVGGEGENMQRKNKK